MNRDSRKSSNSASRWSSNSARAKAAGFIGLGSAIVVRSLLSIHLGENAITGPLRCNI